MRARLCETLAQKQMRIQSNPVEPLCNLFLVTGLL